RCLALEVWAEQVFPLLDGAANEVRALRVFVTLPPQALSAPNLPASFVVRTTKAEARAQTTFLSGAANTP
ncbi:hypothetical protein, partial [Phenylobacterium sp.]|uniref:hypothetical protein n=1 Tax=Phenylobacterium sp. TaxID=1871053 RepID=UPI00286D6136